jgi:hypothetical protein
VMRRRIVRTAGNAGAQQQGKSQNAGHFAIVSGGKGMADGHPPTRRESTRKARCATPSHALLPRPFHFVRFRKT